ncbi:hypothetical protein D1007_53599 [Hordeum vulgare]|nr:hypothetical protein D1007_53599 [Hordeum vulgare]
MRITPPIFTETTEPLDADDWIRTIEDLLALVKCTDDRYKVLYASHCLGGTTRAWWDGFLIMREGEAITWAVFKEGFHAAHIPPGMMTIKKREFRALRQGSGTVKEYLQKFNLLSRLPAGPVWLEPVRLQAGNLSGWSLSGWILSGWIMSGWNPSGWNPSCCRLSAATGKPVRLEYVRLDSARLEHAH